ncbi:PAS domain-containing protein [Raineyella fluvialis]|uniref:histidine kinase n=1 Tax=Raineyella fluvialis TaxID=2662261 RepID=A0A5Q2FFL5_9ACTN|nr:PAS domain S-box protein [Raineyella fluvialis]QGF23076.1 PAS domain S-box protein [Raineyella fluvialis]
MTSTIRASLDLVATALRCDVVVFWRITGPGAGTVLDSTVTGLAFGAPWLPAPGDAPGTAPGGRLVVDPALFAALLPTAVRLDLAAPLTGVAWSCLDGTDHRVTVGWAGRPPPPDVPALLAGLQGQRLAETLTLLESSRRETGRAARLSELVATLDQAVALVSLDGTPGIVNAEGAKLLGVPAGEVPAARLAAALETLRARSLEGPGDDGYVVRLATDPRARITDWRWTFPTAPTHLRVATFPVDTGPRPTRAWVFDDVSAERESEDLLRATVEGMLEPHALIEAVRDTDGRVLDFTFLVVNQATLDYWGMDRASATGTSLLGRLPGLVEAGLFDLYVEALETGRDLVLNDQPYENEQLGKLAYYDIRAIRAATDRLSLSWADVTDRHRALQALEEASERFRLLAENASDIVFRGSTQGIVEWVSPSVTKTLGWVPAELIGRRFVTLVHPGDVGTIRAAQAALDAGLSQHFEARLRTTEGGYRWMETTVKVVLDDEGRPLARIGNWRDIEAEREARQEAREEHARFDAIRASSTDAFVTVRASGEIVAWNPAATTLFGYTEEEALGRSYALIVPEPQRTVVGRLLADLDGEQARGAASRTHALHLARRDGSLFPAEASVAVWAGGEDLFATAIIRDVTARDAAQEALRASKEELAEAQRLARAGSWAYDPVAGTYEWSDELLRIHGLLDLDPSLPRRRSRRLGHGAWRGWSRPPRRPSGPVR